MDGWEFLAQLELSLGTFLYGMRAAERWGHGDCSCVGVAHCFDFGRTLAGLGSKASLA